MGGKGRRRREKNYEAAHGGGNTRLPPPPSTSSLDDVMPSKLRKMMSFAGAASARQALSNVKRIIRNDKETPSDEGHNSTNTAGVKRKRNDEGMMTGNMKHGNKVPPISPHEKKKKKKKGKKTVDLRFETEELGASGTQRKEHKKLRLEAKKKKSKKARTEAEAELGFRGVEEIKFGDVVQAPPKLIVPKAFKTSNQEASQERLRLQAVDAYRKHKGWTSRPGVQLPSPVTTL